MRFKLDLLLTSSRRLNFMCSVTPPVSALVYGICTVTSTVPFTPTVTATATIASTVTPVFTLTVPTTLTLSGTQTVTNTVVVAVLDVTTTRVTTAMATLTATAFETVYETITEDERILKTVATSTVTVTSKDDSADAKDKNNDPTKTSPWIIGASALLVVMALVAIVILGVWRRRASRTRELYRGAGAGDEMRSSYALNPLTLQSAPEGSFASLGQPTIRTVGSTAQDPRWNPTRAVPAATLVDEVQSFGGGDIGDPRMQTYSHGYNSSGQTFSGGSGANGQTFTRGYGANGQTFSRGSGANGQTFTRGYGANANGQMFNGGSDRNGQTIIHGQTFTRGYSASGNGDPNANGSFTYSSRF